MFSNLTGWHALLILAAVLLVFGAAKLPALARSVGQSVRILKAETRTATDGGTDAAASGTADAAPAPAPVVALTPAPAGEPIATSIRTAS